MKCWSLSDIGVHCALKKFPSKTQKTCCKPVFLCTLIMHPELSGVSGFKGFDLFCHVDQCFSMGKLEVKIDKMGRCFEGHFVS